MNRNIFYNFTLSLLIYKFKALVCVYGVHCGLWPLLDLPPLNKKIKLTIWGHPKKILTGSLLRFWEKKNEFVLSELNTRKTTPWQSSKLS